MNNLVSANDEDIEMLAIRASRKGDIAFLEQIFLEKKLLNIFAVTEVEHWNWLHTCNLYSPYPIETVNFYITHGVEVNAQDGAGMTPLHYAMRARNAEAAIALLNAGADPNIPNQDNSTPLSHIGYMPDRLDILELMLKKGANVHFILRRDPDVTILESNRYLSKDYPVRIPIVELMEKYA